MLRASNSRNRIRSITNVLAPGDYELQYQFERNPNVNNLNRWNQLAALIHQDFPRTFVRQHVFIIVELTPANGVNSLQRTFRNLAGITGEVLNEFFEEILHSDDTVELDGLIVSIQTVGETIRRDHVGRSYEALPKGNYTSKPRTSQKRPFTYQRNA